MSLSLFNKGKHRRHSFIIHIILLKMSFACNRKVHLQSLGLQSLDARSKVVSDCEMSCVTKYNLHTSKLRTVGTSWRVKSKKQVSCSGPSRPANERRGRLHGKAAQVWICQLQNISYWQPQDLTCLHFMWLSMFKLSKFKCFYQNGK